MANLDIVAIETLNRLLVTCNDCAHGFHLAAAYIENPDLQVVLQRCGEQHHTFALTLQIAIADYGGRPATSATAAASLHWAWISLKSMLDKYNDQAILEECTKGQQYALRIYNEALQQFPPLPDYALDLAVEQQRWTQETLEFIETLKPAGLLEAVV